MEVLGRCEKISKGSGRTLRKHGLRAKGQQFVVGTEKTESMKSPKNGNQSGNQTSFVCYGDIRVLWGQRKQNPRRAQSGNPSATSLPLFTLTHCPQVCGSGRDGLGPQFSTSARVHALASSSYRRLGEHQQGRRKKRGWNTFSAGRPCGFLCPTQ